MKRSTKIILICALAVLVLGASAVGMLSLFFWEAAEGTRLSSLGYEKMTQRDYDGAITSLTEASDKVVLGDNRFWLYVNLGSAQFHQKHYDEAIKDFTTAIEADPSRADPYERRGQAYEKKKETDKALTDYDRAIERDPNLGLSHLQRGRMLYDRDEIDKALADFQEVTRIWPNYAYGFLMRGRCYLKLEEPDLNRALASFDAASMQEPWNAQVHDERAKTYLRLGDSERAFFDSAEAQHLAGLPRALPRPGPSPSGRFGPTGTFNLPPLADLMPKQSAALTDQYRAIVKDAEKKIEIGAYDNAIQLFNKGLALGLSPAQISFLTTQRGICFFRKGEFEKAEAAYDEAIKINPRNAVAFVCRGASLDDRGESDDALQDYAEAIRVNPHEYFAYCYRGIAFFHLGEFEKALTNFAKAIEISSTRPDAYLLRAGLCVHQKSYPRAIADCSTGIEFHPDSFRAYAERSFAYLRSGEFDLAERDLKTAEALAKREEISLHNSVAWFRSTCPDPRLRDRSEALREAQRSCEMVSWSRWGPLDTLAAAEAEAGDFRKAVEYEERALELPVPSVFRDEVEARLALFRQHKPFREAAAK